MYSVFVVTIHDRLLYSCSFKDGGITTTSKKVLPSLNWPRQAKHLIAGVKSKKWKVILMWEWKVDLEQVALPLSHPTMELFSRDWVLTDMRSGLSYLSVNLDAWDTTTTTDIQRDDSLNPSVEAESSFHINFCAAISGVAFQLKKGMRWYVFIYKENCRTNFCCL